MNSNKNDNALDVLVEKGILKKVYPSEKPDELEIVIEKYIARDMLGTMLIYELLKTKKNADIFIKWIKENDKRIEFEDALKYILDLRIKEHNFNSSKYKINEELFSISRKLDPDNCLTDEQISFLVVYCSSLKNEKDAKKYLKDIKPNSKDLRWLVLFLIHTDK